MRFEGVLSVWQDDRGFGRIESDQGGEPIFVHISAFGRGVARPQPGQRLSFEVETGPKGKRACRVQPAGARAAVPRARPAPGPSPAMATAPAARPRGRTTPAPPRAGWGTATWLAIPAFLLLYLLITVLWRPPIWVAGGYLGLSVLTFIAYAGDKQAAERGAWRTSEQTLHLLALAGGWPGALLAQQWLRHKSRKQAFRQTFWLTVGLNLAGLLLGFTPLGPWALRAGGLAVH